MPTPQFNATTASQVSGSPWSAKPAWSSPAAHRHACQPRRPLCWRSTSARSTGRCSWSQCSPSAPRHRLAHGLRGLP